MIIAAFDHARQIAAVPVVAHVLVAEPPPHEVSLLKARARRRRWRDKNPGYMREYRLKAKARVDAEKHRQIQAMLGIAIALLLPFAFGSCTVATPSAATQVTYRSHVKAGLQVDESKRMIHYLDSPPGVWYDVAGAKWTFDEDGWRKLP
jgi:hypothetical protein